MMVRMMRVSGQGSRPRTMSSLARRFWIAVAVTTFILMMLLKAADISLKPTILAFAEAKGRGIATEAMNMAINSKVVQSIRYEDLMAIRTDNRGKVSLVQPNTGEINRLAAVTVMEVQRTLKSLGRQEFHIPLGQVLGSQLLAAKGPRIRVNVIPIGSVTSRISDSFEQAGINQTRHRIYLRVKTVVKIVVPLVQSTAEVEAKVPITEAVIMGEVPQVYFGGDLGKYPAVGKMIPDGIVDDDGTD